MIYDAGVHVGEANMRIVEFGKVVLMDGLLKLILEALNHHSEGVVHLFCHFVVDEDFTQLLGECIGRNAIKIFAQVVGLLEELVEALCILCFRHHDAQKSGMSIVVRQGNHGQILVDFLADDRHYGIHRLVIALHEFGEEH